MYITKAELIELALNNLCVLGTGQPVEVEDAAKMDKILRGTISILSARKVVHLRSEYDTNQIPEELLLPLARILASDAAPAYGIGGQDAMAAKQLAMDAENDIRSIFDTGRGVQPTPADYF